MTDNRSSALLPPACEEKHTNQGDEPFRLMVESVAEYAMFTLDPEGRITTWNRGAERILGYKAAEITGYHCSIFYPEEAVQRSMPEWEMSIAEKDGHHEHEDWRIRKDGSRFWTSITTTALRGHDGRLVGFGKVIRDLTAKRLVEEDLRERKNALRTQLAAAYRQMRSITDSLIDGILEVGPDWKILFGNHAAATALPDFELGKTVWECFPALLGTPVEQNFRIAMAERSHISYENFYAPYDMWFRVKLSPTDHGISVIYTDITRERQMQDQLKLEQLLREKRIEALSHMAAGLSHEISNPLAIIRATASDLHDTLAAHQTSLTVAMGESCESILFMADRAMRILKGLRGFAREADNDPLEWASPYDIVEQCVDMQYDRFDRKRIELRVAPDNGLPPLLCREVQIGQILTNLLNNAYDAIVDSPGDSQWVSLTASIQDSSIVFRVTDSGPGVAEHFRAHLMEPFFTTKVGDLGMGIGLSLSRAIAEGHNGSLVLLDGEPHTCFQLSLPIDPETIVQPEQTNTEVTSGS